MIFYGVAEEAGMDILRLTISTNWSRSLNGDILTHPTMVKPFANWSSISYGY